MKITQPLVLGLSLFALAACRSSEPAPAEPAPAEPTPTTEIESIEEVGMEETIEEVVPASLPEVRYYEIADT